MDSYLFLHRSAVSSPFQQATTAPRAADQQKMVRLGLESKTSGQFYQASRTVGAALARQNVPDWPGFWVYMPPERLNVGPLQRRTPQLIPEPRARMMKRFPVAVKGVSPTTVTQRLKRTRGALRRGESGMVEEIYIRKSVSTRRSTVRPNPCLHLAIGERAVVVDLHTGCDI